MTVAQTTAAAKPLYLAFIPITGGSAWAQDHDKIKAVADAQRWAKREWGIKHIAAVGVYDITGLRGWYGTNEGLFADGTDEPLKLVEIIRN